MEDTFKSKYVAWIIVVFIFGSALIIASINFANVTVNINANDQMRDMVTNVSKSMEAYQIKTFNDVNMTYALALCQQDVQHLKDVAYYESQSNWFKNCYRMVGSRGEFFECEGKI